MNNLSNEDLALFMIAPCDMCAYLGKDCTEHDDMNCYEGYMKWLEQEHEGSENK